MSNEVKVGMLFIAVALLVTVVALWMSDITARMGTYGLTVYFKDVKGLTAGADVLLAGVRVGKVLRMDLDPSPAFPERPVRVRLVINNDVHLFETDSFVVDQGSLIGDRFVMVRRPTTEQLDAAQLARGEIIPPGSEVEGGALIGFASLSDQLDSLIARVEYSLEQFTETYAGAQMREDIQGLVGNLNRASRQAENVLVAAGAVVDRVNGILLANQAAVARTVRNIESASADIRTTTQRVASTVQGLAEGPIPASLLLTVANVRRASEDLRATADAARGLVADADNQQRINTAIANVAQATDNLRRVSEQVEEITGDENLRADLSASLADLRETMENFKEMSAAGRELFTARETLENIRLTLENARRISDQGVDVTARADRTLERVESTMEELDRLTAPFHPHEITGTLALEATAGRRLRGDLDFDLRYPQDAEGFWRIGVRDLGRTNRLNLQRAFPLSDGAVLRGGVIAGQLGVGVDYAAHPRLQLEAEAWNVDRTEIDLRAIYRLDPEWHLTWGLADAFKRNELFLGMQRALHLHRER